jgi:predicted Zn-dependent peptidase
VRKYVGDNGITVVHEHDPRSPAFCIGVWLKTGSRDEREGEGGMSHFLEHMLFKGTRRRSQFDISQAVEKVGGSLDAFTTKEQVCVSAHVLQGHADLAVDLLDDMLRRSVFSPEQIELEKGVVLGEIREAMDAPDDVIHDLFAAEVFPKDALGRPILGTTRSVTGIDRETLVRFSRKLVRSGNVVISVFGALDRRLMRLVCDKSFRFRDGSARNSPGEVRGFRPVRRHFRRRLYRQHICIGGRASSYLDDRRYPQTILATLLGGGMSSRLFQRIREELGLAYSIFTYAEFARDTGLMGTYMAVKPASASAAIAEVFRELEKVRRGDIREGELRDMKEQLKGRILLGLESSSAKMVRNARSEIYYGRQVKEREIIEKIERVTLADLVESARDILDPARNTVVSLGPSASRTKILRR